MALSLTDINVGSAPNDGTGDTLRTAFQSVNTNNGSVETAVNETIFTMYIETPADQDYVLTYDAPFAGSITSVRTKTEAGTCTVTTKIEGTALGGTANSASTTASTQNHSSSNTYSQGAKIHVTISSTSSASDLEIAMVGARS